MISLISREQETTGICAACGIPFDSQYFDDSNVETVPKAGESVVLARFDLPAQYCGVLQYFAQYTDAFAKDNSEVETPNIEWRILVNNHPVFPYINLRRIVNPWGSGSYPVNIRLDENSTLEFVARGVPSERARSLPTKPVAYVGGRLIGRFWYNASYGDVMRAR